MSAAAYLELTTLAFLAPLPPEWPSPPSHPKGSGWVIGLTAGFLLLVTLVPLSLALAEKWNLDAFGAACRTSGGYVSYMASEDRKPYRCAHRAP